LKFSSLFSVKYVVVMVFSLTGVMYAGQSASAQQNPIPNDLLALDHQRCMNGCVPGFGEQTCKLLCDCTIGEFKKQLSFEAYLDMSVQLSRNAVTPEMQEYLGKVANFCTAELDRKGIEVGQGVEPPPADPGAKPSEPDKPK